MKRKLTDTDVGTVTASDNFKELRNLVAFVTDILLPKISELESKVGALQDIVEEINERGGQRRRHVATPKFFLGIEEDSDEEAEKSYVGYE